MSSRPDIELALDVRSYERIVVVGEDLDEYPENWSRPRSIAELLSSVDEQSVVLVDRFDIKAKHLGEVCALRPRLLALAPADVPQEKSMRRLLSVLYPWAEVWTVSTSFGKLLVTSEALGLPYDRENVRDDRPSAEA